MVFTPKKKKKDWLNTSVNKENHHGLVYSKDCDIGQTEYWIIEYWIQKAQNLAPVWSAKSSNSCDPSYEVMEELWFFPCQPCYCCKYVSVKVVCGVVLRVKLVNSRGPRVNLQVYLHNQRCWLKSSNFAHTYST